MKSLSTIQTTSLTKNFEWWKLFSVFVTFSSGILSYQFSLMLLEKQSFFELESIQNSFKHVFLGFYVCNCFKKYATFEKWTIDIVEDFVPVVWNLLRLPLFAQKHLGEVRVYSIVLFPYKGNSCCGRVLSRFNYEMLAVVGLLWSQTMLLLRFLKIISGLTLLHVGRGGHQTPVIQSFLNFKELKLFSWKEKN